MLEYSLKYSDTTGSLWFYSKDEVTNYNNGISTTDDFRSFKYKAELLGNTVAQTAPNQTNAILKNITIAVPLNYLSNFGDHLKHH